MLLTHCASVFASILSTQLLQHYTITLHGGVTNFLATEGRHPKPRSQ